MVRKAGKSSVKYVVSLVVGVFIRRTSSERAINCTTTNLRHANRLQVTWFTEYFRSPSRDAIKKIGVIPIPKINKKKNGGVTLIHPPMRFEKLSSGIVLSTKRLRTLKEEIMDYIEVETAGIGDDQILLGSSDIIESVFGRYKGFSGKTPMKEVGRAVLAIPVFTGKFDAAEVRTAMESVPAKDVDDWLRQNIGESFLSKRKRAFSLINTNFKNSSVKLFPENLRKVASF